MKILNTYALTWSPYLSRLSRPDMCLCTELNSSPQDENDPLSLRKIVSEAWNAISILCRGSWPSLAVEASVSSCYMLDSELDAGA